MKYASSLKWFMGSALVVALAMGCDVRRNDKITDDQEAARQRALKDSTTVEVLDIEHDFGTVKDGDKVNFSFRFKNTGSKPLVITSASSTCGCTVPEKPEKPVMPGETSFIKVVFNSTAKVGHVEKPVTVLSNANPPFPTLTLKGEVLAGDK